MARNIEREVIISNRALVRCPRSTLNVCIGLERTVVNSGGRVFWHEVGETHYRFTAKGHPSVVNPWFEKATKVQSFDAVA